eukprot:COSAG06_NODE_12906_length_1314_cov_0.922634_1_plen_165_part_00
MIHRIALNLGPRIRDQRIISRLSHRFCPSRGIPFPIHECIIIGTKLKCSRPAVGNESTRHSAQGVAVPLPRSRRKKGRIPSPLDSWSATSVHIARGNTRPDLKIRLGLRVQSRLPSPNRASPLRRFSEKQRTTTLPRPQRQRVGLFCPTLHTLYYPDELYNLIQ